MPIFRAIPKIVSPNQYPIQFNGIFRVVLHLAAPAFGLRMHEDAWLAKRSYVVAKAGTQSLKQRKLSH